MGHPVFLTKFGIVGARPRPDVTTPGRGAVGLARGRGGDDLAPRAPVELGRGPSPAGYKSHESSQVILYFRNLS